LECTIEIEIYVAIKDTLYVYIGRSRKLREGYEFRMNFSIEILIDRFEEEGKKG